ncbi:UNVERIFIED_CONTAM: hypothetical protein FKN15_010747 [Acipenser sinensis]
MLRASLEGWLSLDWGMVQHPAVGHSAAAVAAAYYNWSGPRVSNVIYLGDLLRVEASVAVDNHVSLRLYVDGCIATLSDNKDSEPR